MKKKPVIYWLSDSPLSNTGYGTITKNILNGLSDEFECHVQAHNYMGQTIPPGLTLQDGTQYKFWLHGTGMAPYSQDLLIPRIQNLNADIFFVLLDTFMLYPWIMNLNFSPAKTGFYFPSDGGGHLPLNCENVLKHFKNNVAMAKFGQEQVKTVHGIDTYYIPHAVDEKLFSPLSDYEKSKIREEMVVRTCSGNLVKGVFKDKFVVGVVARNQGRKMLDRTIKSFSIFCKDKPNAVLYFHSDAFDPASVFDMNSLIRRYNLENRVFFSPMRFFETFEAKEMPKVYNVMDVFFLTTSGEGFGIPTVEAMSCGIPVVVTDYTTTQELVMENGQCGYAVKVKSEITGSWNVERAIMDDEDGAECLTKIYNNPELGKSFGKVGREKVLKYYTWEQNIKLWKDFLWNLIGGR
jgi:D-inositol-3-phosphate glycosyltransferase